MRRGGPVHGLRVALGLDYTISPGQPAAFIHRYFTWIQAGKLRADYASITTG